MKKFFLLCLTACMLFCIAACEGEGSNSESGNSSSPTHSTGSGIELPEDKFD